MSDTPSYDLHKLGWRAFQDLTSVILQSILGQTFHTFADSNDVGRDGAFHGFWERSPEDLAPHGSTISHSRATVVQCKFSVSSQGTLSPSKLKDEVSKVEGLHDSGLCDAYVLVSNLTISGKTDAWLRKTLSAMGVENVLCLDGKWINQQIIKRPDLRRYVPRVYGLGDLGQILNDRHRQQAQALLGHLGDDLKTFVPTAAYKQAADALAESGFVLLLGAPAVGKSTIAATLAITAVDSWGSDIYKVRSADELIKAWDPSDPDQLFWIDDAFGNIRHDLRLTNEWSSSLHEVMTAVSGGAKVILTSRDYIYRQARPFMKEYAYPLLREQKVVVDVADLSQDEKQKILYNHLKAGDQPAAVLRRWRKHLPQISTLASFQPEVARRLAQTAFTRALTGGERQLLDYMSRPVDFLRDILGQLDPAPRAALACVYLSGEGMAAPISLNSELLQAVSRMGSTEAEMHASMPALRGTFLKLATGVEGDTVWQFRHPTIREGFAASIADDVNVADILVKGLSEENLLTQVDCGGGERGTLVSVPRSLYADVASRVSLLSHTTESSWSNLAADFLGRRCSDDFLRLWVQGHSNELGILLKFGAYLSAYWQPRLLARLYKAGSLPERIRAAAVLKYCEIAVDFFDASFLDPGLRVVFTADELDDLLSEFENNILPDISWHIDSSADGYSSEVSPAERYEVARNTLLNFGQEFANNAVVSAKIVRALDEIDQKIDDGDADFVPPNQTPLRAEDVAALEEVERDVFDDVDAGHE